MSKTPRLKEKYFSEVVPALEQKFGYGNIMQVPKVVKVTVNMGVSDAIQDPKVLEAAAGDMQLITGQKPVITRAKKSIAAFKVREGMPIGCKVTLRGPKMYYFLDKLFNAALPRIRDFRGVSPDAFDGRGNYTLGLKEQLVFPEVEYDKVDKIRGMDITIVTSASTDEEGLELLKLMGLPVSR